MESEELSDRELRRRVIKHHVDLYEGDGQDNPSITTRLALMEDILEKVTNNLRKIVWLLIGGCVTAVITLIVEIIARAK